MRDQKLWANEDFHRWPLFQALGAWTVSQSGRRKIDDQAVALSAPSLPTLSRVLTSPRRLWCRMKKKVTGKDTGCFLKQDCALETQQLQGEPFVSLRPAVITKTCYFKVLSYTVLSSLSLWIIKFLRTEKSLPVTVFLSYNIICNWHPVKAR